MHLAEDRRPACPGLPWKADLSRLAVDGQRPAALSFGARSSLLLPNLRNLPNLRLGGRCLKVGATLIVLALAAAAALHAQDQDVPDTSTLLGIKPQATYHFGDIDSIDIETGNLAVKIPLYSLPQRGNLSLSYSLVLNTGGWSNWNGNHGRMHYGFNPVIDGDAAHGHTDIPPCGDSCGTGLGVFDDTGAFHVTPPAQPTRTIDGSDYYTDGTNVTRPDGIRIDANGSFYDTNGNTITRTPTPCNNNAQNPSTVCITDTLGRSFSDISMRPQAFMGEWLSYDYHNPSTPNDLDGSSNYQPDPTVNPVCSGLPGSAVTASITWKVPAPAQTYGSAYYVFCFVPPPTSLPFSLQNNYMLQEVVLPGANGSPNPATYWAFQWDNMYGDLLEIRYPTGATIDYTYSDSVETNQHAYNRRVNIRTVTNGNVPGGAVTGSWYYCSDYSLSQICGGLSPYTEPFQYGVIDPSGNATAFQFNHLTTITGGWLESARNVYKGPASSNQLSRSVTTNYEANADAAWDNIPYAYNPDPRIYERQSVTTTLDDGSTSTTSYQYDTCGNGYSTKPNWVTITDYDNATVLRKTYTRYWWEDNSTYLGSVNLLDRVSEVSVQDGARNRLTDTRYFYDESAYSPGGIRGNQTTIDRWNSGGSDVLTHKHYNANGMVTQSIDANGNATTYDYDGTGAFLADIKYPSTSAWNGATVKHEELMTYDPNSGEQLSHTDENGGQATATYDALARPTKIIYADMSTAAYNYTDGVAPSYTVDRQVSVSQTLHQYIGGDDLGQAVNTIKDSTVDVNTVYDVFGRVTAASNPYYVGSGTSYDSVIANGSGASHGNTTATTNTQYNDPLGRVTEVDRPDGTRVTTSYSGPWTTVTDESGRSRASRTDPLGRVVEVAEDPGGDNFETDYFYDALGNLLCVDQQGGSWGAGGWGCDQYPDAFSPTYNPWRLRQFFYDSLSRLTEAQNPESGTIYYSYDANGNVTSKTDGDEHTVNYCYDALNRLTGRGYNGSCGAVTYGYDKPDASMPVGPTMRRRTYMSDASGVSYWNYDAMGRMIYEKRTVSAPGGKAVTKLTYYSYNYDGTVASLTYPSGRVVNYYYNNMGWNTTIRKTDFFGSGQELYYANNATYMPDGQLAEVQIGQTSGSCFGGIWGEFSYNVRLQPLKVIYTTDTPTLGDVTDAGGWCSTSSGEFVNKRYQFGMYQYPGVYTQYNNGTIGAINNCLNGGLHLYTYDNENRINWAQSIYWGDDYTENYNIDPWGNLTNITGNTTELLNAAKAYDSNQLPGNSYDPAGNVTSDGINTYQYDPENRISVVSNGEAAYTYDGDGQRVTKSLWGGSSGTIYWYGTHGEVLAESDLSGNITAEYVYFNGKRLARTDNPTDFETAHLRYYISDHLGSTDMVMDETFSNVLEDMDYYPYGGVAHDGGLGDLNHYFFTGKERDSETGLDYYAFRYYASNLGRFLSPDWEDDPEPIPYALLVNPQTLNLYAYVENNPTSRADPNGHCAEDICVGEAILAGVAVYELTTSPAGQAAIHNGLNALANAPAMIASLFRQQSAPGSRPGQPFTPAGKKTIDAANAAKNGGKNACTKCGKEVRKQANKAGQSTPSDQLQRHHVNPRNEGGSGTPENGEVLCPLCHMGEHFDTWLFGWWSENPDYDPNGTVTTHETDYPPAPPQSEYDPPAPAPLPPSPVPPDPCANGCYTASAL
jgi:RHS repeat-associated protein